MKERICPHVWHAVLAGVALLSAVTARAQLTVSPTSFDLLPDNGVNPTSQTITLNFSNTGSTVYQVDSVSLQIQVTDGAPTSPGDPGTPAGPGILGPNAGLYGTGTLFQSNNDGAEEFDHLGGPSQFAQAGGSTGTGTVSLSPGETKVLGRITLDTTGLSSTHTYYLSLQNTVNGDSLLLTANAGNVPIVLEAALNVVPEINGAPLIALALGAFAVAWRCRRKSAAL